MFKDKPINVFFLKILILALPLGLILAISFKFLIHSKEIYSNIDSLVDCQSNQNLCQIGLKYSSPTVQYKLLSILRKKPKIIALGTSRSMAFRSKFFKSGIFFNSGGGVVRLPDFRKFLSRIPKENSPKVAILGFDQYFFNKKWDPISGEGINIDFKKNYTFSYVLSEALTSSINDLTNIELITKILSLKSNSIGVTALDKNSGFLNDGSYHYGHIIADPHNPSHEDYQYKDTIHRIKNQIYRFEGGHEVNPDAIHELELLLKEFKSRNIHVVGFLPPYAHKIFDLLKKSGNHQYIFKIYEAIQNLFIKNGFSLFDATDLQSLGASDEETIDGFHGSEKAYLRLLVMMAENDPILKTYTEDLNMLKEKIKTSSPLQVYPKDQF